MHLKKLAYFTLRLEQCIVFLLIKLHPVHLLFERPEDKPIMTGAPLLTS